MYATNELSGKIRIPSWMQIETSNNGDGLLNLVPLNATMINPGEEVSIIGVVQEDSSKFSISLLDEIKDDYIWIFKESELKSFNFGVQNNTVINRVNKLFKTSSTSSIPNNSEILTILDSSAPNIENEIITLILGSE